MQNYSIVVLISGFGSNLQALIDAQHKGGFQLCAVISNKAEAYGLTRAQQAGIPTEVIDHTTFASRDQFDQQLQETIEKYHPNLVVLAGFMRRLGASIVRHFAGRMINIHPSLLPKYPGLNTHQKALAAGDKEHGVSIHFVTEAVDCGPIITQRKLAINAGDTPETLKNRIHTIEHKLYPQTLQWFAEGRVSLQNDQVLIDGEHVNFKE